MSTAAVAAAGSPVARGWAAAAGPTNPESKITREIHTNQPCPRELFRGKKNFGFFFEVTRKPEKPSSPSLQLQQVPNRFAEIAVRLRCCARRITRTQGDKDEGETKTNNRTKWQRAMTERLPCFLPTDISSKSSTLWRLSAREPPRYG